MKETADETYRIWQVNIRERLVQFLTTKNYEFFRLVEDYDALRRADLLDRPEGQARFKKLIRDFSAYEFTTQLLKESYQDVERQWREYKALGKTDLEKSQLLTSTEQQTWVQNTFAAVLKALREEDPGTLLAYASSLGMIIQINTIENLINPDLAVWRNRLDNEIEQRKQQAKESNERREREREATKQREKESETRNADARYEAEITRTLSGISAPAGSIKFQSSGSEDIEINGRPLQTPESSLLQSDDPENFRGRLEGKRRQIRKDIEVRSSKRTRYVLFGVAMWLIAILVAWIFPHRYPMTDISLFIYGLLFLSVAFIRPSALLDWDLIDIEEQIDLLDYQYAKPEQRAERLFKHHQYELKKYYDQTLRQSSTIFSIGVFCLLIGIAIIAATLYLIVFKLTGGHYSDKIVVGLLGSVGSILCNYVAAIYLNMYSKVTSSLTLFHNRLVLTHHLHYGAFLASKIENKKLREVSIARMAINTSTSRSGNMERPKSTDAAVETKRREVRQKRSSISDSTLTRPKQSRSPLDHEDTSDTDQDDNVQIEHDANSSTDTM